MKKRTINFLLIPILTFLLSGCEISNGLLSSSPTVESNEFIINTDNFYITKQGDNTTGTKSVNDVSFSYFRTYHDMKTNGLITIHSYTGLLERNPLPGYFRNETELDNIKSITIEYKTSNTNQIKPYISYGNGYCTEYENIIEVDFSNDFVTKTFDLKNARYFQLQSSDCDFTINSIKLDFDSISKTQKVEYGKMGENEIRIEPVIYEGELVAGVSKVAIPQEIKITGDSYEVISSKDITYYDFNYIKNNPEKASVASYTTPEDVAAYFSAFNTYPVNFCFKSDYDTYAMYFFRDTRCVSKYSRTDGYARAVPYKNYSNTGKPLYYECDMDINGSYSNSSRGAGRLVVWVAGFKGEDYGNYPVCVFTDDHYSTFSEYLNYKDCFSKRFNAEDKLTSFIYSYPKTLKK